MTTSRRKQAGGRITGVRSLTAALVVALTVCLLAGIPTPRPAAAETLVVEEKALWGFAEELMRQGEFYRAFTEYRRLLHFFPRGDFRLSAPVRMGEALLRGGEPERAVRHFENLLNQPEMAARADNLRYLVALSRLESNPRSPHVLREQEISGALRELGAISPQWPQRERVTGFLEAMAHPPPLPEKSPWLAGGLSALLPGAGSFYVGRYAEGSLALFANTVLFYGAGEAFRQQKEGLGGVLGSLALVFYGGSVYAAANGAHKFNGRAQGAFLEKQRLRFGIVVQNGALAGAFQGKF